MNSHVGSISYDKINNLIWIPDTNGVLRAYNVNNFLNDDYVIPLYTFNNVSDGLINYQNKKENEIAFLTIYDNYIYLGSFGYNTKGLVKKYYINNTKKIKLELVNEFKIPSKVQGLTLFEKDNDLYMLLSRSYGRNRDSYIEVYKYSDDVKDYNKSIKTITLPPMIEQITLENNKLYAIFESNALKYIECENKIDDIIIFDINKILFSEDY